jgi:hypothetical protein
LGLSGKGEIVKVRITEATSEGAMGFLDADSADLRCFVSRRGLCI